MLGLLQSVIDYAVDDISVVARAALRSNCRNYVESFAMPDLEQITIISGIPLASVLTPSTNAARLAAQEAISTMGQLQQAYSDRRRPRAKISAIMKAMPKALAALVRVGILIQTPSKLVWFSADHICPCESVSTKIIRLSLLTFRIPNLGAKLEKIYKRVDWPPPRQKL